MDFGKLSEVDNVKWTLPAEDPLTAPFLRGLGERKEQRTHFYVGAPIWQQKGWKGKIYPTGMPDDEALFHYSRTFNCIELNPTHYAIPSKTQVTNWVSQVPPEFRFLPKFPKEISHAKNGLLDKASRMNWLKALGGFGENLGPSFLQFGPAFSYDHKAELFHFLEAWPSEFEISVEFRHPTWFSDGRVLPALTNYLQKKRVGLVITDVAGRRDVLHSSVSAPFSLLRFIGNDFHPSDIERIKDWSKRINLWQSEGLRRFYFCVHQPDNLRAPETADKVIQELNATSDAGLEPVHWVSLFNDLFDLE